jgi:FkbM family methyltransferase
MLLKEKLKLLHRTWRYRWQTDKAEIHYLLHTIKNGSVVMDVGAHKGGYTYWMIKAAGNKGKVIAFEPQQKGYDLLRQLFSNQNTVVEHLALSDHDGITTLYIQPQSFDVSFEASLHNKYENFTAEKIETTTIDNYCRIHQLQPSFIKIDVEGAEQEVVNGASTVLKQSRPTLLIEAEQRHIGEQALNQLFKHLQHAGYRGYFFFNLNKIPLADFKVGVHQDVSNLNSSLYANNFVFEPL